MNMLLWFRAVRRRAQEYLTSAVLKAAAICTNTEETESASKLEFLYDT
jgi:hypothetical protein